MSARWEYRSVVFDFRGFWDTANFKTQEFERTANDLGRQGWELVNVFDTNQNDGNTKYIVAFFKRPLEAS